MIAYSTLNDRKKGHSRLLNLIRISLVDTDLCLTHAGQNTQHQTLKCQKNVKKCQLLMFKMFIIRRRCSQ